MREYYPLIIVGAVLGTLSVIFVAAYFSIKNRKAAIGFDRNMKDSEIVRRLLAYAKPHIKSFLFVLLLMVVSIAYEIISPIIVGEIEETIKAKFELSELYIRVALYAGVLVFSLVCTYFQAIVLQKTGQKISNSVSRKRLSRLTAPVLLRSPSPYIFSVP